MEEGNDNQFNLPPFDSISSTPENYDQLWNTDFSNESYFGSGLDFSLIGVGNLLPDGESHPSSSGVQTVGYEIKNECLDSCQLSNVNQQEQNAQQQTFPQPSAITVSTSSQISHQIPSSSVPPAPSSLPASQSWPGEYEFNLSFGPQEKNTKSVNWTYSRIKEKLYVKKDAPCPINFSVNSFISEDVSIRVMALYTAPDQVSDIVKRCLNHSVEEINKGVLEAEHLIRCESPNALYHKDMSTNLHSVSVPFENPPVGQQFSTYIYKFTCLNSCAGGPNRRQLMLVFTLERCGAVIGRRKINIKICACPGRDRKMDEAQVVELKRTEAKSCETSNNLGSSTDCPNVTRSDIHKFSKKRKHTHNKDEQYTIQVKDRDTFEYLKQQELFFNLHRLMQQIDPELIKQLLNDQKKKGGDKND